MGDRRKRPLRVNFNPRILLEFHGARLSSDGGLLAYRELDERLGLTTMTDDWLVDSRRGLNKRHSLTGLLRQSVYARLAGYEDLSDAERLRVDPIFRQLIGGRAAEKGAASISQMARVETEMLRSRGNLHGLEALNREWVERAATFTPSRPVILDLDSSESPTHGQQEGSAYNGHFAKSCYHPLFCFNHLGDLEGAMLREGNVASAHEWRVLLEPVVSGYRRRDVPVYFRADAAFAMPEVYEYLEGEQVLYAIRIKANAVLERRIEHLLRRRVGRPSKKPEVHYESFSYQAKSWDRPRRVVAKVEWHAGELFPGVGFIVTNLNRHAPNVVVETGRERYEGMWLDIASSYYPAHNVAVDLTIAPINTNQKEFPRDLRSKSFDDPVVIARFKKMLDFVFSKTTNMKISSLNIGSEYDIYFGTNWKEWRQFQTFYQEITRYVRSKRPGLCGDRTHVRWHHGAGQTLYSGAQPAQRYYRCVILPHGQKWQCQRPRRGSCRL